MSDQVASFTPFCDKILFSKPLTAGALTASRFAPASFRCLCPGGAGRWGASRPTRQGVQPLLYRKSMRSQSKESTPPKDLDLVTKKVLSARLLKIGELQNALAEQQRSTEELQMENRTLKQVGGPWAPP